MVKIYFSCFFYLNNWRISLLIQLTGAIETIITLLQSNHFKRLKRFIALCLTAFVLQKRRETLQFGYSWSFFVFLASTLSSARWKLSWWDFGGSTETGRKNTRKIVGKFMLLNRWWNLSYRRVPLAIIYFPVWLSYFWFQVFVQIIILYVVLGPGSESGNKFTF